MTKRGRKIQNFGATEAKYEVIAWYLDYARATFQAESEDAVQDAVARKEKQRLERLIAKRNGQVTKGEIESMRSMVKMNELTDEAKIGEYMLGTCARTEECPQNPLIHCFSLRCNPTGRLQAGQQGAKTRTE